MSKLSIINKQNNEDFLLRINALTPVSKPLWGKMDVAQMFAHCNRALKLAFAKKLPKRAFIGYLIGGFLKKRILGETGFGKNSPTAPELLIQDERSFEQERETLISLVKRLAEDGISSFPTDPHPLFGPMTPEEWDLFHAKHLDHHLRQFGV